MDNLVQLPPHRRAVEVRSSSFEEATNSVEVVWTTGAKVRRYSWRDDEYYDEELVVSTSAIRLDRLNNGAPFLDTHDDMSLASIIGTVVPGSAKIAGGKGIARVALSVAPEHAGVVANVKAGIIRNISVGYRIHRIEKTEGDDGSVPTWRIVDWESLEISAVPIPADAGSMIRSEGKKPRDEDLAPCAIVDVSEGAISEAAEEFQATRANASTVRAERVRSTTIRNLAATVGAIELGELHSSRNTSIKEFRGILIDHLAREQEKTLVNSMTGVSFGRSDAIQRAAAIKNALMHRANPAGVELTPDGRNFRGLTLIEIGRDVLEANGVTTRGMSRQELASQALMQRSGGMHTTSDFPGILANLANTTLRNGYDAAPQTFRPLVRETSVSDFKAITRTQLSEAPALNKVNEHGEFKRGTLGEGKESYKIATYGRIIAITRQVLVNDDLDAFTRIPQAFGVQAAQLESDLVWAQILANPVMGDSKTLFHADHSNIMASSSIGLPSLSQGRSMFAMQTDMDGKTVLGLVPQFLIVPVALQTAAEQFVADIIPTRTSDVVPNAVQRLQVIAEARLSAGVNRPEDDIVAPGSASTWYLAGSIVHADVVELAYLDGNRGVYTETRTGFDVDGIEIKARLDVGAKAMDWRNIARNAGG